MTTINMERILGDQKTHIYNMKNDNEVRLENLEHNFLDDITVRAQGNTVSIAFCGIQTILKFTNISDLNAISLIVHDSTIGGYTGTFKTLFDDAPDSYLYTMNKNTITGTIFNDTISVTDEMLDDKFKAKNIGFNITSDKGDDSITATSYNDTIQGGDGNDRLIGNAGNDSINAGAGNDSIWAGAGNDTLIGGDGDDYLDPYSGNNVVNAGAGNDTIIGGAGNNTITGGAGENLIAYNILANFNDVINLTKGEDLILKFNHINTNDFNFREEKGDLIMSFEDVEGTSGSITLKGFASKDVTSSVTIRPKDNKVEGFDLKTHLIDLGITDKNFTGGWLSQQISGEGAAKGLKLDGGAGNDSITGSDNNDTILGGIGDDTLDGGLGNDSITGGAGTNIIKLYTTKEFGDDVVTLTKGEKLNFMLDVASGDYTTQEIVGNDLVITVYSQSGKTSGVHSGDKRGSVTIKNYTKSDVVTSDGALNILYSDETVHKNLRLVTGFIDTVYMKEDGYTKSSYTGNWLNQRIDAQGYKLKDKDGNNIETTSVGIYNPKLKGVTINAGGATSYNQVHGSIYADTINGGANNDYIYTYNGDDVINAGAGNDIIDGGIGNDTITGGTGENTIKLFKNKDFGDDTVVLTKGEKLKFKFEDVEVGTVQNYVTREIVGNDLVITAYSESGETEEGHNGVKRGSVTIKNYTKSDVIGPDGYLRIVASDGVTGIDLRQFVQLHNNVVMDGVSYTKNSFNGGWMNDRVDATGYRLKDKYGNNIDDTISAGYNPKLKGVNVSLGGATSQNEAHGSIYADTIKGGDNADTIYGNEGDDVINAGAGNDIIDGGIGNDTITGGAGVNIIKLFTEQDFGDDTVVLTKGEKVRFKLDVNSGDYTTQEIVGNDLVITVYSEDGETEEGHNGVKRGSVTIKNYTKSDVIGPDGYLKIVYSNNSDYKNLRDYADLHTATRMQEGYYTKTSYTGSWADDYVSAVNYRLKDKEGADIETDSVGIYNPKLKGVNINLGGATTKNFAAGSIYADTFIGGAGNDSVNANYGDDLIKAGDGNNTIFGGFGNDTIICGKGDDSITAGPGADVITGGAGTNRIVYTALDHLDGDIISLTKGENLTIDISGIAGATAKYSVDGKNLKVFVTRLGETKSFTIVGLGSGDPTNNSTRTTADTSSVELQFAGGLAIDLRDVLVENNVLKNYTGTYHNEIISAEDFKVYTDKEKTVESPDHTKRGLSINAGAGDDVITGSNYSDNLQGGDGDDVIFGTDGNNTISGGNGNDELWGGDGNDTIKGGAGNDTISGGEGNNQLYGEDGVNTFEFYNNTGHDTVFGGKGTDTLSFKGEEDVSNLKFTQNKQDLVIGYNPDGEGNSQDSVTIKNYYDKKGNPASSVKYLELGGKTFEITELMSYDGIKSGSGTLNGTAGNDLIWASGNSAHAINGNGGDDVIYTSVYMDTVHGGDGNDTIYVSDGATGNAYYYGDGGDNVIYMGTRSTASEGRIYNSGAGNDTIFTSTTNSNKLNGDCYFITTNSLTDGGNDTIVWRGGRALNADMIFLNSTNYSDIVFTRTTGNNDLVLNYGENNSVTLTDFYKEGNEEIGTGAIQFMTKTMGWKTFNSSIEEKGGVKTLINGLTGGDENDYIIGTDNAESISAGAGNDVIKAKGGNDTISLGEGNDYLFASSGNKTITADAGNNSIYLGSGNNTVTLGTGFDTISAGLGNNTIEFVAGDTGADVYTYASGNDTLSFKGDTFANLSIDVTGSDVILTRASNDKTVTLKGLENLTEGVTIKDSTAATNTLKNLSTKIGSLTAEAGVNFETGLGNDTIYSGLGNDTISAGTGTNTIYLAKLDGTGNVNNYTFTAGATDTFILPEAIENFAGMVMQKSGQDLVIAYTGDLASNTLTIKNYYDNTAMNTSISFTAGETTKTLATLIDEVGVITPITGTDGADVLGDAESTGYQNISGLGGNDTISGGTKADFINGGAGADLMQGGAGNDTYEIDTADWGDGQDTINDSAGTSDTLRINTDKVNLYFDLSLNLDGEDHVIMDGANATYTKGNDLYLIEDDDFTLANAKTSAGVKIVNHFSTGQIENIKTNVDSAWVDAIDPRWIPTVAQSVANWLAENDFTSVAQVVSEGSDEQKATLLSIFKPIFATTPNVYGTDNNDIIFSSNTMENTISAGAGDDIIFASAYNDSIRGGDGNDTIYGGDGATSYAYYSGDGGNNVFYMGTRSTANSGRYYSSYAGNDLIYTSTTNSNYYNGDYYYITSNSAPDSGNDTITWRGGQAKNADGLYFNGTNYEDMFFVKSDDDLVIRYHGDNSLTITDYYKAENGALRDGTAMQFMTKNTSWKGLYRGIDEQGGEMTYKAGSDTINGTNGNDYLVGSAGNDQFMTRDGNDYVDAKAGNDLIYIYSGNSTVNGGLGDDTFDTGYASADSTVTIYTNSSYGGKDTTVGTSDGVNIGNLTSDGNKIYAQSANNNITGSQGNDTYYAYIDQKTIITDEDGTDALKLVNTTDTTDANKAKLYVLPIYLEKTYESGRFDLLVVNEDGKDYWKTNGMLDKGIRLTDNMVETITSADNYTFSKESAVLIAQETAAWLTTEDIANTGMLSESQRNDLVEYLQTYIADNNLWTQA